MDCLQKYRPPEKLIEIHKYLVTRTLRRERGPLPPELVKQLIEDTGYDPRNKMNGGTWPTKWLVQARLWPLQLAVDQEVDRLLKRLRIRR